MEPTTETRTPAEWVEYFHATAQKLELARSWEVEQVRAGATFDCGPLHFMVSRGDETYIHVCADEPLPGGLADGMIEMLFMATLVPLTPGHVLDGTDVEATLVDPAVLKEFGR